MSDTTPTPPDGGRPASGSPPGSAGATAVPFTQVYASTSSAFPEPVELVVRSDDEWRRAWLNAQANRSASPPAPAVDFATDMVVLVGAGTQPTGGITLRVDALRVRADGATEVAYTLTRPGAGCMSTQQLTAPVAAVRVRRTAGPVHFARRETSAPC